MREPDREPIDCAWLRRSPLLQAYLDGELPAADTLHVQFHLERCPGCRHALEEERAFRHYLRREVPRVAAPIHLRDRIGRAMAREAWKWQVIRAAPWVGSGALASAALLGLVSWGLGLWDGGPDLVRDLVANHRVFSQLETPAELASDSRPEVADWIRRRLAVSVPVPEFRQGGFRLLGSRVASHAGRPMAHLFYVKGQTLLSLYALSAADVPLPSQGWTTVNGHAVVLAEATGYRVLLGRSGRLVFTLVSSLDREDLIECARAFLREAESTSAGLLLPAAVGERRGLAA
jgi:anti-sigma factor (TIGR02949 family)